MIRANEDRVKLFTIAGEVCAGARSGSFQVSVCKKCGRGKSRRIGPLVVDLTCKNAITSTVGGPQIVREDIFEQMRSKGFPELTTNPVSAYWDEQSLWVNEPVPKYVELGSDLFISISDYSVEYGNCECGATNRLLTRPLFVKNDDSITENSIRKLDANPNIIILGDGVVDFLKKLDPALEVERVYYEEEYETVREANRMPIWDDLYEEDAW